MKLALGADHRGYKIKEDLKNWLMAAGHEVLDCGNYKYDPHDDFPDFTFPVADAVAAGIAERGVVICGSGGGVTIAANKVRGIRSAQSFRMVDVVHNRQHDDINVLALGSDFINLDEAKNMVQAFVDTVYLADDRHIRRLNKIKDREMGV